MRTHHLHRAARGLLPLLALTLGAAVACDGGGIDLGRGGLDAGDVGGESPCGTSDRDDDGVFDLCDACPDDAGNDVDADGVCAADDNCPTRANADQIDGDDDGNGDACDCPIGPDRDGDGVCDADDPCPLAAPPSGGDPLVDGDGDGLGDACDPCVGAAVEDGDGDGTCDDVDVCPALPDEAQLDGDGDGVGDACDPCPAANPDDRDGDGVCDDVDPCAVASGGARDDDRDGLDEACDPCPGDAWNDDDGDGVCGGVDLCPYDADAAQADADGDGVGDACDVCDGGPDADDDGACDAEDNCPALANRHQLDLDGDGIGTACDPDEVLPEAFTTVATPLLYVVARGATTAIGLGGGVWAIHGDRVAVLATQGVTVPFIDADEVVWTNAATTALVRETPTTFARVAGYATRLQDGPEGGVVVNYGSLVDGTIEYWQGTAREVIAEHASLASRQVNAGGAGTTEAIATIRAVGGADALHDWTPDGGDALVLSAWGRVRFLVDTGPRAAWFCAAREDGASEVFLVRDGARVATSTMAFPGARLCDGVAYAVDAARRVWMSGPRADGRFDVYLALADGPVPVTDAGGRGALNLAGLSHAEAPPIVGVGCEPYGEANCFDIYRINGATAELAGARVHGRNGFMVGRDGTIVVLHEGGQAFFILRPGAEPREIAAVGGALTAAAVAPSGDVWFASGTTVQRVVGAGDPELMFIAGIGSQALVVEQGLVAINTADPSVGTIFELGDSGSVPVPIDVNAAGRREAIDFDTTTNQLRYLRYAPPPGGGSPAPAALVTWDRDERTATEVATFVALQRLPSAFLVQRVVDGPWYRMQVPPNAPIRIDDRPFDRPASPPSVPVAAWFLEEAGPGTTPQLCPLDPRAACIPVATPIVQWQFVANAGVGGLVGLGRDEDGRWHLLRSLD